MSSLTTKVWRRAAVLGVACLAALTVVYLGAVWTPSGQRFEDAVLRAADRVAGGAEQARALDILDQISVPSVLVFAIIVMVVALIRRRPFLGLVAVAVIAASITTTELFQHFAERPILLAHGYRREDQSFPSGHTAVAMSLMTAVVMVVPYRIRGVAVLITSTAATGVGVAAVTAGWHRPSDTIGADLIAIVYACTAVAVLARCDKVREAGLPTPVRRALRDLIGAVYFAVAVVAIAVAAGIVCLALTSSGHGVSASAMLLAGRLLAVAGSAAVAAALLTLLRHVDLGAPRADPVEERTPDVTAGHTGLRRPSGP